MAIQQGITGFVRIPDSKDPNKVYAIGTGGRPIIDGADLMKATGTSTIADAWKVANVQLISPQQAANYAITTPDAKSAISTPTPTPTPTATPTPTTPTPTPTKTEPKQLNTSLVDIWSSRPDLQQAFPQGTQAGTSDNSKLNNWWNEHGVKEYPNTTLVAPGSPLVTAPKTIEEQQGIPRPTITTGDQALIDFNQQMVSGDTSVSPPSETTGDTTGDTTGGDPNVDMTGWSQDMIDVFTNLTDLLEAQIAAGNTVSPDIEIDETILAGFLTQAQKELDPYYGSVIQMATQDLSDTLRYRQESFDLSAQQAERQYGLGLEQIGEARAETGEAFSGRRLVEEQRLAQGTQEAREQARRDLLYQTSGLGTAAERMLGSTALGGMNFGTISGAPTITAGQAGFQRTGTTPLYQLSGGIMGELERERTVAESLRSSELEESYRAQRAADYANY
uniref:Uncharacterized protein n=1 Tax=viral metagenome TaxID=1070528 RepID=A0A6H1ZGN2_9ZZZZ